jgi:hypothetical protein
MNQPRWWPAYIFGAALMGLIVLIEASVPSGAARLFLELATIIAVLLLMLGWLRVNRERIARWEPGLDHVDETVKGGDSLMADKPSQNKPAQPSGGQTKPIQPQPSTPKK